MAYRLAIVKILCFWLILLTSPSALSQNSLIEDLEKRLGQSQSDSARMMTLAQLFYYTKNVDTTKARTYVNEALTLGNKLEDVRLKATAYRVAGVLEEHNFNHDAALRYFYDGLAMLGSSSDKFTEFLKASITMDIGNTYLGKVNLSSAITYFLESLRYFEKKQANNPILIFLYCNIATTYSLFDVSDKNKFYTTKAVELAERIKNNRALAYAYNYRARAELGFKPVNYQELDFYNEKSFVLANELNEYFVLGNYHSIKAAKLQHQGSLQASVDESMKAIKLFIQVHAHSPLAEEKYYMAVTEKMLGRKQEAKKHLLESMRIAYKINCVFTQRLSVRALSELTEDLKENNEALHYYKKYQQINDSLLQADKNAQIFIAETQYESALQKEQITALEEQREIQNFLLREKSQDNKLLIVIIVGALGIALLGYLFLRGKQKIILQNSELQHQRISELEKDRQFIAIDSLLKGQEEERSRLARDIHDGVGSVLSSVKHTLTSMKGDMVIAGDHVSIFNKSVDLIDYSMTELRRVAHNMMPEGLIRFGLKEALQDFCNNLSTKDFKVGFIPININERFDGAKEIVVYRIVQELINNTLKHAAATEIIVQLVQDGKQISLTVEDNGKGFDTDTLKVCKGAGWTNVYNRVNYLNGKIDLDSKPGLGTSVVIEFDI
jgi:signal transduction histidine kinase